MSPEPVKAWGFATTKPVSATIVANIVTTMKGGQHVSESVRSRG